MRVRTHTHTHTDKLSHGQTRWRMHKHTAKYTPIVPHTHTHKKIYTLTYTHGVEHWNTDALINRASRSRNREDWENLEEKRSDGRWKRERKGKMGGIKRGWILKLPLGKIMRRNAEEALQRLRKKTAPDGRSKERESGGVKGGGGDR